MPEFNLPSYLEHSKKVDVSDMDFRDAAQYPLSEEEIRCLTYMMDIETHTIVYLKGILFHLRDSRSAHDGVSQLLGVRGIFPRPHAAPVPRSRRDLLLAGAHGGGAKGSFLA